MGKLVAAAVNFVEGVKTAAQDAVGRCKGLTVWEGAKCEQLGGAAHHQRKCWAKFSSMDFTRGR